jgi:hypothetical protein
MGKCNSNKKRNTFVAVETCIYITSISISNATYSLPSTSLPLHVSAVHVHHQVHVSLAKTVPLYVKITDRV